ncbi:ankyrin repeat protein [Trichoderma barbatum]
MQHHESESARPEQIPLNENIIYLLLTKYLDKHQDILNFARINKQCYESYISYLHRHNVRYGGCSALEWAAMKDDVELVRKMLEVEQMEEFTPKDMWSDVLNFARVNNNIDLTRLLFQVQTVRTSMERAAATTGLTVLHHAAIWGHLPLVKVLVEDYGADPDIRNYHALSLIEMAASNGHTAVVEWFCSHDIDHIPNGSSISIALLLAVKEGHENVVRLLLQDDRLDLNARNDGATNIGLSGTPLELAAKYGRDKIVRLLLDDGRVDVNTRNVAGMTPLLLAASSREPRSEAVIEALLADERVNATARNNVGRNACILTVISAMYQKTRMILEDGRIDPNQSDNSEQTPAMHAAEGDSLMILGLLMADDRVNLERRNIIGHTALVYAVRANKLNNVERLLNSGRVDVDRGGFVGDTPLMWAFNNKNFTMVKMLLDTGRVDLNKKCPTGKTPLMHALRPTRPLFSMLEMVDIVKMILNTGHDMLNLRYDDGLTILGYEVQNCRRDIVQLLLGTGKVDVTQRAMVLCEDDDITLMLDKYQKEEQRKEVGWSGYLPLSL